MKILCVIPARYASTRFPGKPLAMLDGKPVVQWVWQRVSAVGCVDRAIVATDDDRIFHAVNAFGGEVMMTSDKHRSGTDRCAEVADKLAQMGERYDVVINVQGDEPFVDAAQIETLAECFQRESTQIATLAAPIASSDELFNANNVKVVRGCDSMALYFSRQPIPFQRDIKPEEWIERQTYYKHVGIYAFRYEVLHSVASLDQTPLEKSEKLEQLRWLENGYRIAVADTAAANVGIDTPADLAEAERYLQQTSREV